jgi:hypothetical protein
MNHPTPPRTATAYQLSSHTTAHLGYASVLSALGRTA